MRLPISSAVPAELAERMSDVPDADSDEIEARALELASEAIKEPEQLRQVLNDEQLVYELSRIMSGLASANKEFSKLPLSGNWAICGLLQAANELEQKLLDLVNDDDWKDKAARALED